MNCPIDRGGCGKQLKWHEGAFCDECMKQPKEQMEEVMNKNREFEELHDMKVRIEELETERREMITGEILICSSSEILNTTDRSRYTSSISSSLSMVS